MSAIVRSSISYDFIIYCNAKREMWRLSLDASHICTFDVGIGHNMSFFYINKCTETIIHVYNRSQLCTDARD